MAMQWLNELGDRNPQLLRELRARFQVRSVGATIGISLALQVLVLLFFVLRLPERSNQHYCLSKAWGECSQINWKMWWGDLCRVLTMLIPYIICIPGIYALTSNISQEAQKGTLNFLRLSPRSSYSILLGKLVGVPILGYLSLALIVPFQILAAVLGGIPIGFLLSFYLMVVAEAGTLFLIAMFIGFSARNNQTASLGNTQGLAAVIFSIFLVLPSLQTLYSLTISRYFRMDGAYPDGMAGIKWFSASLSSGLVVPHLFFLANFAMISGWVWFALQRAFRNPGATLLSKLHSYLLVLYSGIFVLGFIFNNGSSIKFEAGATIAVVLSAVIMSLLYAVATPRQILLDWMRHRQEVSLAARSQGTSVVTQRSEQIWDWVLGEKSPGVIAIGINLLMAFGMMLITLCQVDSESFAPGLIGAFLTIALIANYGFLVQLLLMMKTAKRNVWAFGGLACAILITGIASALPGLGFLSYFTLGLWVRLSPRNDLPLELGMAILALMAHGGILFVQMMIFRFQMRQLARQM
jgi:hypothetical protein